MTNIHYPTCINTCYVPENGTENGRIKSFKMGETRYYALNPCMLRLKFAQLAATDWVVQPLMTLAMIVGDIYMAIRVLFDCVPDHTKSDNLKERVLIAGGLFLHALSLPFVMFIPALLALYSVFDVKNGRHAYCMVEKYMYNAMGMKGERLDNMDVFTTCKPFLSHMAKPFAPVKIVKEYEKHCVSSKEPTTVPAKKNEKEQSVPNNERPKIALEKPAEAPNVHAVPVKKNEPVKPAIVTVKPMPPKPAPAEDLWIQDLQQRSQFTGGLASACTSLAVYFASTANKACLENRLGSAKEIGDILDLISKDKLIEAGFVNGVNYDVPNSIPLLKKLTSTRIQIDGTWTFDRSTKYASFNSEKDNYWAENTWQNVISLLNQGQGAVVSFGEYSFAVRRLEKYWEVFDAHNGKDLGAPDHGAYIKRYACKEDICAFLEKLLLRLRGDILGDAEQAQLAPGQAQLSNGIVIDIL